MNDTIAPAPAKRNLALLVLAELAALSLAAVAVITYDLGWIGAVAIAVLVAGFTLLIVRAGEKNAIATGNSSPAMLRYHFVMLDQPERFRAELDAFLKP